MPQHRSLRRRSMRWVAVISFVVAPLLGLSMHAGVTYVLGGPDCDWVDMSGRLSSLALMCIGLVASCVVAVRPLADLHARARMSAVQASHAPN